MIKKLILMCFAIPLISFQAQSNEYSSNEYGYNGYCNPCENYCGTIELSVDWLYWNTRKCGLDYLWQSDIDRYETECGVFSITKAPFIEGSVISVGKGKPKAVDLDCSSGIRALLAWETPCNRLYFLRYTYYSNDESDSFTPNDIPYLPSREHPDQKGFVDRTNVTHASGKYEVDLHNLDVGFGYVLSESCDTTFTLSTGFKWAKIDQEMKTRYHGISLPCEITSEIVEVENRKHHIHETVDMNAYGLFARLGGHRHLCGGLSLFGHIGSAILAGDFERSFHEKEYTSDESSATPCFPFQNLVDVCDDQWCLVKNCEIGVGTEFNFCCGDCFDIAFSIGYEFNLWSEMLNFIQFVDHHGKGQVTRADDSIGFDGLFIRGTILF